MPKTHLFHIEGMRCAGCASTIEKALLKNPVTKKAAVNYGSETARVESSLSANELIQTIESSGYGATQQRAQTKPSTFFQSIPALCIGLFLLTQKGAPFAEGITACLLSGIVLFLGREFFIHAAQDLRHRRLGMDTLIALGSGSAFLYSCTNLFLGNGQTYFESAALIVAFVLFGRSLESNAKKRSRKALEELFQVQQGHAVVIENGQETKVPLDKVNVGQTVRVRPGERIPLDGVILEGESSIDEALLTGESLPIHRKTGDHVSGGTICVDGELRIRIGKNAQESATARILSLVEKAQGTKAPSQKLADRVSAVFVPAILVLSFVVFAVWFFLTGNMEASLFPAVTVLVVACPCALGLATPAAIVTAISKASSLGLLVRDAESIETMNQIDVLVLDKTGTLTEGTPKVVQAEGTEGDLQIFSALADRSLHPLAKAIALWGNHPKRDFSNFTSVPGMGLSADLENQKVLLGSTELLKNAGVSLQQTQSETTTVYGAIGENQKAVFHLEDSIRNNAKQTLESLRKKNLEFILCSGDSDAPVSQVAKKLGITEWHSKQTPQQKLELVQELQKKGKRVGMVGDGHNDAPALAQADVGFAIASGADIALEGAAVTLMKSDLSQVERALNLGRKTVTIIRQNLFWAFLYNLAALPLAATGKLNPAIASGAMALSSLSVVLNSLRLNRVNT